MAAGGNSALREFFATYKIDRNSHISTKYVTKASAFYREMLNVVSDNLPYNGEFLSIEIGNQPIGDYAIAYPILQPFNPAYPSLENPQIVQDQLIDLTEPAPVEPAKKGLKGWFTKAYNQTINAGNKAADRLNNFAQNNPTMQKVEQKTMSAVNKVNEITKQIAEKPQVKFVTNVAITAANQIATGAKITYNKLNSNPTVQQIKKDTMNFLNDLEDETRNASNAAVNYIQARNRVPGEQISNNSQEPLLQNSAPDEIISDPPQEFLIHNVTN